MNKIKCSIHLFYFGMGSVFLLTLFFFHFLTPYVHATEKPLFFNLTSDDPKARHSLSADCDGDAKSNELNCRFVQIMVRKFISEQEYEKQKKEFLEELEKTESEEVSGSLKGFLEICKTMNGLEKEIIDSEMKKIYVNKTREFCKQPNKEGLKKFIFSQLNQNLKTCRISNHIFRGHFVKVSENKWVSDDGPYGLCNRVNLKTLEVKDGWLWTYTEKITYSDDSSDFCKGRKIDQTTTYSWKPKTFLSQCEFIEFGL